MTDLTEFDEHIGRGVNRPFEIAVDRVRRHSKLGRQSGGFKPLFPHHGPDPILYLHRGDILFFFAISKFRIDMHARKSYIARMFRHETIRIRRIALQLTVEDLARKLCLASPSAISLWERGKRTPSTHTVGKLAQALQVPVSYFYDLDGCVPRTHLSQARITRRQHQVLFALAAGLTHREIATWLRVSSRTVDFHHRHLNRQFGVSNIVLLLRESARLQLLPKDVLAIPTDTLLHQALVD